MVRRGKSDMEKIWLMQLTNCVSDILFILLWMELNLMFRIGLVKLRLMVLPSQTHEFEIDRSTTEFNALSLHDPLPISPLPPGNTSRGSSDGQTPPPSKSAPGIDARGVSTL